MPTELQTLFNEINKFDRYPANIKRICGDIPGNIFFPGGQGILNAGDGKISGKEIMIAGEQFDDNFNFNRPHGPKKKRISPVWRNFLLFLISGGIDPERCFFTNVLLGAGIQGNDKRSSGYMKRYFLAHCRSVFRMELDIQQPKVILILGLKAAKFLSSFHPALEGWARLKSFNEIDQRHLAIIENVPLTGSSASTLVLLVHPVGRQANIKSRKFRRFNGDNAEIMMISSIS